MENLHRPASPGRLDDRALDQLFRAARTRKSWAPTPVSDALLEELYHLLKFGPTSVNGSPVRLIFVKSGEAKAKLAQLHVQTGEVNRLLETGSFLEMYVPALAAKEVALDLESYTNDVVPSQQRQNATNAIQRLVASAWLLDMYGDQGDRQKLAEAYTVFASAVKQIDEIFSK